MEEEKYDYIQAVDLTGPTFLFCATLLIILFWGTPDLMDVILYSLTNGEVKLPE